MSLLSVEGVSLNYGGLRALEDASFSVERGDLFVLLGANGAGKTSMLRCISGLESPARGRIRFGDLALDQLRPHERAHVGISHVLEGRRVFPYLSVEENLIVSHIAREGHALQRSLKLAYELFPRLSERRTQLAGTMSGGEQQALAIGRALMNGPSLLMLDEPSLGLSPLLTKQVFQQLVAIRQRGISILLVEQNASSVAIASRGVVLANGKVVLSGTNTDLRRSELVRRAYLGM
jgi:branched-chain amino acid transport system ATP-binding protein